MRSRNVDLLRAAAIARVIVYHVFGRAWLTIAFPAMGVMFALAGSLMAASVERRGPQAAVKSRVRRLLPPLWALGLVAVTIMLAAGWSTRDTTHPLNPATLLFWIFPVGDPPGSTWGMSLWEVLWYIRAYLWFVLLTPLVLVLYRKSWWAAIAAPLVLLAGLTISGWTPADEGHNIIWDVAIYGPCWIIGFAHHDGRLARVRLPVLLTVAGISAVGGMAWLFAHHLAHDGDLNDVPVSQALWSLAFMLLVLRWRPSMDWLDRMPSVATIVRFINARAVTIYLWHNPLIPVAGAFVTMLVAQRWGRWEPVLVFGIDIVFTLIVTLAIGWVEDLAARRRPAVVPVPVEKIMVETV